MGSFQKLYDMLRAVNSRSDNDDTSAHSALKKKHTLCTIEMLIINSAKVTSSYF